MFERLSAEPIYNTRAVVQRTSVPADTFRAWERRYGVPVPIRTPGNQRLYSERDIATIAWLRDQTSEGMTISQAVALLHSQKQTPARVQNGNPPLPRQVEIDRSPPPAERSPYARLREQLVDALIHLDGRHADRIV